MTVSTIKPELLEQVRQIVAEVLAVEPAEVEAASRFFADLGGESIDFLDLQFRCEKHFGVRLKLEELLEREQNVTDESGELTAESLGLLRARFAFLDFTRLPEHPTRADLTDLITTEAIAHFVAAASATQTPTTTPAGHFGTDRRA